MMQKMDLFGKTSQNLQMRLEKVRESSSPHFYRWVLSKLDFCSFDDTVENIAISNVVAPCQRLLDEGVDEEIIMSLPSWVLGSFLKYQGSFSEYETYVKSLGFWKKDELTFEQEFQLEHGYSLEEKSFYEHYSEWKDVSESLPVNMCKDVSVLRLLKTFEIPKEFLPLLADFTREDVALLASMRRGNVFVCLFFALLLREYPAVASDYLTNISDTARMSGIRWITLFTRKGRLTFPLYDFRAFSVTALALFEDKYDLYARFYQEGCELIVEFRNPFLESKFYQSWRPVAYDYPKAGQKNPVKDWCCAKLECFGVQNTFNDAELESQIYFILREIESGNQDWTQALKKRYINSVFRFYKRGEPLYELLLRVLQVLLRVRIEVRGLEQMYLTCNGIEFYLYDILLGSNFSELKSIVKDSHSDICLV